MFIYQRVIVDSRNSATSVIVWVWIDQKMFFHVFSHPLNIPRFVSNVLDHSNRPMPNGFQGHTSLNDASCCWLPIAGIPGVARWPRHGQASHRHRWGAPQHRVQRDLLASALGLQAADFGAESGVLLHESSIYVLWFFWIHSMFSYVYIALSISIPHLKRNLASFNSRNNLVSTCFNPSKKNIGQLGVSLW